MPTFNNLAQRRNDFKNGLGNMSDDQKKKMQKIEEDLIQKGWCELCKHHNSYNYKNISVLDMDHDK